MTDLAAPTTEAPRRGHSDIIRTIGAGVLGGTVLGVAARAWMRLISEDPEFSWSGTIFIVVAFAIFGLTQSVAAVTRRRSHRSWAITIARSISAIGVLPLFVGAGALMLPTVVGGGLAYARGEWRRPLRGACLGIAAAPVLFVGNRLHDSFGWSLQTLAGMFGMLALYGTIIRATRSTFAAHSSRRSLPRWAQWAGLALVGLLVVHFTLGFVFTG